MSPKDIKGLFLLLIFALTAAFFFNWFSPFGIALVGQRETSKKIVTSNSNTGSGTTSIETDNSEIVKQQKMGYGIEKNEK